MRVPPSGVTDAAAIIAVTFEGKTARRVSKYRPAQQIIGVTPDLKTYHQLALSWGVLPVLSEQFTSTDVLFYHALRAAKENLDLKPGDSVVMTGGITNGKSCNTNLIKIETVE